MGDIYNNNLNFWNIILNQLKPETYNHVIRIFYVNDYTQIMQSGIQFSVDTLMSSWYRYSIWCLLTREGWPFWKQKVITYILIYHVSSTPEVLPPCQIIYQWYTTPKSIAIMWLIGTSHFCIVQYLMSNFLIHICISLYIYHSGCSNLYINIYLNLH